MCTFSPQYLSIPPLIPSLILPLIIRIPLALKSQKKPLVNVYEHFKLQLKTISETICYVSYPVYNDGVFLR